MSTAPQSASHGLPDRSGPNLADLLLHAAAHYPHSRLIAVSDDQVSAGESLTYPSILEEAQRILGGLREQVPTQDGKVVLLLERARDFIPAFWACVLGGYVPCPMVPLRGDPERWSKHVAHVDRLLDRPLFVSIGKLRRELPDAVHSADLQELRAGPADLRLHHANSGEPAVLVLTSGSTGNAKAVVLTHGNLLASMAGKAQCQQLTARDITLNWISFDHVAALLEAHVLPLYVGASQVHVEPQLILAQPLLFLLLIDRFRVTMSFSPNFLFAQINAALQSLPERATTGQPLAMDLSCVRHIVSGGEAIVVETGLRFLNLCEPYGLRRDALWPAFGMTETCAGSVYSQEFPQSDSDREFAHLGRPINHLQMRFVNEHDAVLPAGETGELQLRGPMIFGHYYNNPEATAAAFTADGWFRTGDVGRADGGRLTLVGRNKDSIIVSGVNYFSSELETALDQLEGIERSFVAVFPTRPKGADTEQLVIAFAPSGVLDDDENLYQVLTAVRNTTVMLWGFRPTLVLPLPKAAFPKTSLGKIQRTLMRQRLETGEYGSHLVAVSKLMVRQLGPHVPPQWPLEAELAEAFAQLLGIELDKLSTTVSFFDLGGTSLEILKLTQTLERRFGCDQALPLVLQNPTVRKLAASVASGPLKHEREYDPIVPMQVTGKKTPLFCVHPGNGEILILVNLAKYFVNERPFLALRPRGFNAGEACFESFEEMVNTYLAAILKRQPRGPYALAGYSLGCPIAFELAKRIEASGEQVAFLGSIDGFAVNAEPPLDEAYIATGLAALLELITWEKAEELELQLRGELRDADPCAHVIPFADPQRLAELDLDVRKFSAWARVAYAVENIIRGQVTAGTVKTMHVFRSAGLPRLFKVPEWHALLQRWDAFVQNPKYIDVPGEHYTLMAPKHVASFQDRLRAEVDAALDGQ